MCRFIINWARDRRRLLLWLFLFLSPGRIHLSGTPANWIGLWLNEVDDSYECALIRKICDPLASLLTGFLKCHHFFIIISVVVGLVYYHFCWLIPFRRASNWDSSLRACSCPTKVPRNNTVGRGANSSNSSDVLVSTGDKLNVDLVSDRNNIQVRVLLLLCSVLGCGLAARAGLGMGLRLRLGEETATSSVLPPHTEDLQHSLVYEWKWQINFHNNIPLPSSSSCCYYYYYSVLVGCCWWFIH